MTHVHRIRSLQICVRARALSIAAGLAICTTCATGVAQQPSPDDEARASSLYQEGTRLLDTGDLAQACPRLEEAVRLVPDASGAHLALGVCFERSGRLASALLHLEAAAKLADPATLADRRQRALESAAKVRPHVPRLVVQIAAGVPASAIVRVDGRPAPIRSPVMLDAGRHEVELLDGSQVLARRSVTLRDGEETRVDLAPERAAPSPIPPPPAGEATVAPGDEATATDGPPWTAIGVATIGVGGAGLVLGTISGTIAADRDAASDGACDKRDFCTAEGAAARDEAFTWATVSTVSFVAGSALAAAGIVILVVDSGSEEGAPSATLRVSPTGVDLRGAF